MSSYQNIVRCLKIIILIILIIIFFLLLNVLMQNKCKKNRHSNIKLGEIEVDVIQEPSETSSTPSSNKIPSYYIQDDVIYQRKF